MKNRFKRLIEKMVSLSFFTWILIYVAYIVNKTPFDVVFFAFTGALIGGRMYRDFLKWKAAPISMDKSGQPQ